MKNEKYIDHIVLFSHIFLFSLRRFKVNREREFSVRNYNFPPKKCRQAKEKNY